MNPESSAKSESSRPFADWATHAALLLVQVAFACQAVEAKLAMLPRAEGGEGIFPEAIAMLRMLSGAIFFQASARVSAAPGPRLDLRMHAKLLGLGFLGIAANQAFFLWALGVSTPFTMSLLAATIPVVTAGLAILFRKERASVRTVIGVAMALSGVLYLVGVGSGAAGGEFRGYGATVASLNVLSYAAYVVFSQGVIRELGARRAVAWFFTYGALLFCPIGIVRWIDTLPLLTLRGCALLAFIVAVGTIAAYWLHAWALARSTPTVVSIYIYLQPVFAAVLGKLQLGLSISPRAVVSGAFILSGVAVTTLFRARPLPPPPSKDPAA